MLAYRNLTRLDKILDGSSCSAACPAGAWGYLPLGSGCALKTSRVSCLVITLSSSSAPASLSRSINPISGRICSWVSSRSCSGVWAGTERVVAERRRLVMISPPCVVRPDDVASRATRFLFLLGLSPPDHYWWHSIYQPQRQLDQSDNDDCAEDNELSENKLWSVGRANLDYYAPRAHRNVTDILSTDCALARWRAGVLLRRGAQIAVSHDDPPRIEISHEQMKG